MQGGRRGLSHQVPDAQLIVTPCSTRHPEHQPLSLQGGRSEVSVTAALPGIPGLAGWWVGAAPTDFPLPAAWVRDPCRALRGIHRGASSARPSGQR